ncbi:1522_t:CDS:2 [Acaulospora colombiana]|uniref:1522_t:CDS:1 n=1 Tax=Acaulospora colombiana TaxID=27376 RepID=A0ACA9KJK0_9GLOM|nr:1522_t:CDS:2 [Acaulospora colombiana]
MGFAVRDTRGNCSFDSIIPHYATGVTELHDVVKSTTISIKQIFGTVTFQVSVTKNLAKECSRTTFCLGSAGSENSAFAIFTHNRTLFSGKDDTIVA